MQFPSPAAFTTLPRSAFSSRSLAIACIVVENGRSCSRMEEDVPSGALAQSRFWSVKSNTDTKCFGWQPDRCPLQYRASRRNSRPGRNAEYPHGPRLNGEHARFKGGPGGPGQGPQKHHHAIVVLDAVRHREVLRFPLRPVDEDHAGLLADIDRDEPGTGRATIRWSSCSRASACSTWSASGR